MASTFATVSATPVLPPDPTKHVNYTLGMLLGVDDFRQEFAYLSARLRWLARDSIGYGTLHGLSVSMQTDARGPRVMVGAGSALLPSGQLVCVKPAQCAYLNDWLAAHLSDLLPAVASPPGVLRLYLTLCYRECPTDKVPIPGEPCRSEDDLTADSRLVDDFILDFHLEPPRQLEEEGIQEFSAWLDSIIDIQANAPTVNLSAWEAAVRAALPTTEFVRANGLALPFGSPLNILQVSPAQLGEVLRVALRLWVTLIRPLVRDGCQTQSTGCDCDGSSHTATAGSAMADHLLLARLDVPLINVGPGINLRVDDTQTVLVDESERPLLASTRLLQERMLAGQGAQPENYQVLVAGNLGAAGPQGPAIGSPSVTVPGIGRVVISSARITAPDAFTEYVVSAIAIGAANIPAVGVESVVAGEVRLRVTRAAVNVAQLELQGMRFMVEVKRIRR